MDDYGQNYYNFTYLTIKREHNSINWLGRNQSWNRLLNMKLRMRILFEDLEDTFGFANQYTHREFEI